MTDSTESCNDSPLAGTVRRNIDALRAAHRRVEEKKSFSDHVADAVTAFSGSVPFIYLHVVWFGAWIVANLGLFGIPRFDPYPFGLLTMIVSLEAIFLSTFVLVSQNRQAELTDRRADLDVQIDLLAEHEVTRILCLVTAIAKRLEVPIPEMNDLEELEQDTAPDALLRELEKEETADRNAASKNKHDRTKTSA